ncbi:hypothetical protein DVH05_001131 [Phytophthora capsici]|nr:hypothetical protein DVH05_001131 [Phytophthora capsici]
MGAASCGNLDLARLLTEKGVHVIAKDSNGRTALMGAGSAGDLDVVRYLIEKQARSMPETTGMPALLLTCEEDVIGVSLAGKLEIMGFLLENGADTSILSNDGSSAVVFLLDSCRNIKSLNVANEKRFSRP